MMGELMVPPGTPAEQPKKKGLLGFLTPGKIFLACLLCTVISLGLGATLILWTQSGLFDGEVNNVQVLLMLAPAAGFLVLTVAAFLSFLLHAGSQHSGTAAQPHRTKRPFYKTLGYFIENNTLWVILSIILGIFAFAFMMAYLISAEALNLVLVIGSIAVAFLIQIASLAFGLALQFGILFWLLGRSKVEVIKPGDPKSMNLADYKGQKQLVKLVKEWITLLSDREQFTKMGGRFINGLLLYGPPGTGKTLLARAVAGEAGVPFFSISGSEFVEMFVGVGAARVRDLFQQAKQHAPCIIFIDELDAIGQKRSIHLGAVNDEREQTLNQLLAQMDGFEPNAGVIILAATNRPEVLDAALLRPGRFDRQVIVDTPDLDGREAILKVHARGKRLAAGVQLRQLAQATAGFSGADLANVLNEAALLAARRGAQEISQADLENAVEKVVAGPERKSRRLTEQQKRRVAYHELGHALVAAYSPDADPVRKITIIPHGHAALGYTLQVPTEDQFLLSQAELLTRLRGMLGGRASEELEYGDLTTGAQNDLQHATALARQMVCLYGMSKKVGMATCVQPAPAYLPGQPVQMQRDCSEQTARDIDEEVNKLLNDCYGEAKEILAAHRADLRRVVAELLKHETLDGETLYKLIGKEMPKPKEPAPIPVENGIGTAPAMQSSAAKTNRN